jgi:8-oxo-dGTP diphosphatase
VNYIGDYEDALARHCRHQGFDGVGCGHIHHAEIADLNGITYMNCGDWVESCTALAGDDRRPAVPVQWSAMADSDHQRILTERLEGWQPDHVGTLVFVRRDDQVLLIRKQRGHGAGKINGPGGKVDPGETPQEAAVRETAEEVGIRVRDPELMGRFRFVDLAAPQWLGYIYLASRFEGTPHPTEEADPAWYPIQALPFDEMWDDDRFWLPRILERERLEGDFLFDEGRLLAHRLRSTRDG